MKKSEIIPIITEVTGETIIGDLVLYHPETAQVLFDIGMYCLGCPSSQIETVAEAAEVHGVPLDSLIEALNQKLTSK